MKSLSNPLGKRLCVSTNYAIISNRYEIHSGCKMIYDKYNRDHLLIMSLTAINCILLLIIIYNSFTYEQEIVLGHRWLTLYITNRSIIYWTFT